MLEIKRILVPVDFSETSDKAFDYALSLARVFEAEVIALHILQEPILYQSTTDQSYRDAFEQKMQSNLDALLNRHTCETSPGHPELPSPVLPSMKIYSTSSLFS